MNSQMIVIYNKNHQIVKAKMQTKSSITKKFNLKNL
uniref:Uncharacterized protein n=1 Tax=Rhizophora mucronata TaxID=61149 RepID=A0A2P2QXH6_RHIMU